MSSQVVLNDAAGASALRLAEVRRVHIFEAPWYNEAGADWRTDIVNAVRPGERVLDVGKSLRHAYDPLVARVGPIDTLDINIFEDYPNLVADICQPIPAEFNELYDCIISLGQVSHVYDPQAMIDNIHGMLRPGGRTYVYAPFIFQYSGPFDQSFQDYYRFTIDAVAYMFRHYARVEVRPIRGRYSAMANLLPFWKARVERWRAGAAVAKALDRLADKRNNVINASGYAVTAYKA